jgi:pimeloyl-ACP methyl ester carboxylesterase
MSIRPRLAPMSLTIAAASALLCGFANASERTPLSECKLPELDRPARCGIVNVLENKQRPDGRRIPIHVAVVPASSGRSLPDPILILMGGPGEESLPSASFYARQLALVLQDRDLLLIDQRGTGKSNGLRCALHSDRDPAIVLRDVHPPTSIRDCAKRLSTQADLTQYTYAHFAKDIEHVRQSLGYDQLNLSAGSYGTRAAQVYIRTYPTSVRTAFFGSVVPIDVATPLQFAKAAQTAFGVIFDACADDVACRAAYPNLRQEFATILSQLDSGSVRVTVPGSTQPVQLYRGRVVERLRSISYRREGARTLPWLIHQAHAGNWRPITDSLLSDMDPRAFSDISFGLFFTITCNEDIPFVEKTQIATATDGTYLGDYRLRQQQAACELWPKVSLPSDYRAPVHSSVPALFVSGDLDPAAPLWYTTRTAAGFSNRFELVMQGYGHTEWNDCVGRIYQRFVSSASVAGLNEMSCGPPLRLRFKI